MASLLNLFPVLLALICVLASTPVQRVNNRPIIGILTEPTTSLKFGDEYVEATYVHFLEMAGARVVPVRGKQPVEYYQKLFSVINGVFFPGGEADISTGPYYQSGRYLYDMAIKANDAGDYFPIWGTCDGLQLLTYLTAKKDVLQNTDTENLTLPLQFQQGYQESRLFKDASDKLLGYLSSEAITQNNHHFSLLLHDYSNISTLNSFYRLISTSIGPDQKEFVSTFEAFKYPIYGVQWHPEKNIFLWRTDQAISHDFHAVQVTQYMANFFINEARKSFHHYNSTDEEAHAVIENAFQTFIPDLKAEEVFYFNYTDNYFVNKYGAVL
ncbi:unnamed protein product [Candidula unifasciata]|uniref:folate gamma-glutamyl hydrolase n=1 Tax=Candidula unifasciata TaxID=100452 RepID=A0A8S3YDG0_9EUPU|nr:unnamed protein product [Candidula unifasciata]